MSGATVDAVVYIRVSTEEQGESGLGLDAQLSACRAHAGRMRWRIDEGRIIRDDTSGGNPLEKRPRLLEALALLHRGGILLVAKRDRLSRDDHSMAMIEAMAKRAGARIVSAAGEGTDSDSANDVLMRRMVDAFAEYERLVIRDRTRAALAAKRARGERTGAVPYGRRLTGNGPKAKRSGLPTGLEIDQAEAEALELVAALRASGLSLRAIAAALQVQGVPTKNGRPWHYGTVRRVVERMARDAQA